MLTTGERHISKFKHQGSDKRIFGLDEGYPLIQLEKQLLLECFDLIKVLLGGWHGIRTKIPARECGP
jgi:hypothetical protein